CRARALACGAPCGGGGPPNGQGAAALAALKLLDGAPVDDLHARVHAVRAGLAHAYAHVGDAPLPADLFATVHEGPLRRDDGGDTTYLCAVDADRTAVSLIQST